MATKREQEAQDLASATRRNAACAKIVNHAAHDGDMFDDAMRKGLALDVFGALIEALEADAADTMELRRKGWQSAAKNVIAAAEIVKAWRDLLTEYRPAAGMPTREPLAEIAVSHRADTPAELDARLEAAFAIPPPVRHVMTVLEPPVDAPGDVQSSGGRGALCGGKDGSWTHRGGANCPTCIATYDDEHGPYAGPVAFSEAEQNEVRDLKPEELAAVNARLRGPVAFSDGVNSFAMNTTGAGGQVVSTGMGFMPVNLTGQSGEGGASLVESTYGVPTFTPPDGVDRSAAERLAALPDAYSHASAEFPGMEPREAPAEMLIGMAQFNIVPDLRVERGAAMLPRWPREADGSPSPGTAADVAALNIVEPTGPAVRPRMSAAAVREHGLARQRGAEHRSVSQVESFGDCGTRAALSDLERPAWWNVGGKALHRVIEELNHAVYNGVPLVVGERDVELHWLRAFDAEIADQCAASPGHPMSTWRAAKKGSEHYDFWRVEGPVMVQRWVTWLTRMLADGWSIAQANGVGIIGESVGPVIEFETRLDVGIPVPNLSIIDLALLHQQRNILLIVDAKAGGSAPKDTFQLGVYGWSLLAAGVGGFTPTPELMNVHGVYWRARTGEPTVEWPVLSMHPWPDVVQRYRDMDAMERQGVYIPNVTTFCGGCGVRDLCPAQASS